MSKPPSFLPFIHINQSDRDKRGQKREADSTEKELAEAKRQHKLEMEALRK